MNDSSIYTGSGPYKGRRIPPPWRKYFEYGKFMPDLGPGSVIAAQAARDRGAMRKSGEMAPWPTPIMPPGAGSTRRHRRRGSGTRRHRRRGSATKRHRRRGSVARRHRRRGSVARRHRRRGSATRRRGSR